MEHCQVRVGTRESDGMAASGREHPLSTALQSRPRSIRLFLPSSDLGECRELQVTASSGHSPLRDTIQWRVVSSPEPAEVARNNLRLAGVQASLRDERMSVAWTRANHLR